MRAVRESHRAQALLRVLCLTLVAGLCCQCKVGLKAHRVLHLKPKDDVLVSYQITGDHLVRMELIHSGTVSAQAAYSGRNAHPGRKVAPIQDLQNLLDKFASHGFFARAAPTPPADARQLLSVKVNNRTHYLARPPVDLANKTGLQDFAACKTAFTDIFNVHTGFSSKGTIDSDEVRQRRARFLERSKNITEQPKDKVGQLPKWQVAPGKGSKKGSGKK